MSKKKTAPVLPGLEYAVCVQRASHGPDRRVLILTIEDGVVMRYTAGEWEVPAVAMAHAEQAHEELIDDVFPVLPNAFTVDGEQAPGEAP